MFLVGDRVRVKAVDSFYQFVDGWVGIVHGLNSGAVEVVCDREDGQKTLFVPAEQLEHAPK